MPTNQELFKEATRSKKGAIQIFNDTALRSHVKNIKCPIHHAVIPGRLGYLIEPNPAAKNFSDDLCKKFGLKKWKWKRDHMGQRIPNYRNHYQPEISAAYARERIYDAKRPICQKCRRCFM